MMNEPVAIRLMSVFSVVSIVSGMFATSYIDFEHEPAVVEPTGVALIMMQCIAAVPALLFHALYHSIKHKI